MTTRLTFLGGVGTVTGSKYLLDHDGTRVLVDCGLFQGHKSLRLRNWASLPVDPKSIDAVVLTHAHLDHSGYLPLLVRNGFRGQVLCTEATKDLCEVLLSDSGFLQEKDADFANRKGHSKHKPALPLYTQKDALAALGSFAPGEFGTDRKISENLSVKFLHAGHILGAAICEFRLGDKNVVFSGDLGRTGSATMVDPERITEADYLVVESTYGNRQHDPGDPEDMLADIIGRTAGRGGTVLIPSFAVGRAQSLLFHIQRLMNSGRIPDLPVFLDSPMAINASDIFCRHLADHRLSEEACQATCSIAHYVRDVEESKALDTQMMPKVIISASGMATGGRILHHLKYYAPDLRNTIIFTGFQAKGTRGDAMSHGASKVMIHGQQVPIRADVENLHMLSAHADADEIMLWLGSIRNPPKTTFITHGEPAASNALKLRIEEELGWHCAMPAYKETHDLP